MQTKKNENHSVLNRVYLLSTARWLPLKCYAQHLVSPVLLFGFRIFSYLGFYCKWYLVCNHAKWGDNIHGWGKGRDKKTNMQPNKWINTNINKETKIKYIQWETIMENYINAEITNFHKRNTNRKYTECGHENSDIRWQNIYIRVDIVDNIPAFSHTIIGYPLSFFESWNITTAKCHSENFITR